MFKRSICASVCAGMLIGQAGCASVMSGRYADVAISSNPPDAHVTVQNQRGETVAAANTPAVVKLKRGNGFLKPAHYTATIVSPGYEPTEVAINPKVNPWIFGNVIFGGLIGLVVDPATGAMWNLSPDEVSHELVAIQPTDGLDGTYTR